MCDQPPPERTRDAVSVPRPPELLIVREAVAGGVSAESVRRLARAGELVRVHAGAYLPTETWRAMRPEARHQARVHAAHAATTTTTQAVYSHESAAVVQGIPMLGELPPRPHMLVGPGGTPSSQSVRRTRRRMPEADVVTTDGLRVTVPAVTAIDLAATRTPLGAVLAICHVRNRCGVKLAELEERVAARRPFRGVQQVEVALTTSSDLCESPLEALVLARCEDLGFARPEQQRSIGTELGAFRVDFAWHDGMLVLEADGKAKYTDPAILSGRSTADAVLAEKAREDAIRDAVQGFTRIAWAGAYAGDPLVRALTRLGVPRIRGRRSLRR